MPRPPPEECANCGAVIPPHARACPECGADERTGWRETSSYDGLELPESAFDDSDGTSQTRPPSRRVNGLAWYWWCVAVAILLGAALFIFGLR
ncbi:MAG TPA: zinc-ribbon domain-containing protein [Opitutus sp.]|nr:zinc-ribbon domain-containing protein [Opitutus sp.]